LCLIAPIIISSTTPASKIPITNIIKGEKLPIVSVVVLAMLLVKSLGNDINVSIIEPARRGSIYQHYYTLGSKLTSCRTIKKAIPIPNSIIINGKLPEKTDAVLDEMSVTMEIGTCIFYYLPFGIKLIIFLTI
jgi:hypothetical protein